MRCLDDNQIMAFLDGYLEEENAQAVELHIDCCPACRRLLSRIAALIPSDEPAEAKWRGKGTQADAGDLESGSDVANTSTELIGKRLGNFRILDVISAGAMGVVYLGEHIAIGHKVAIKVMQHDLFHPGLKQQFKQRFLTEAKSITEIKDQTYIVQLYDFGEIEDGSQYIVMEYLKGHTLARELRLKGKLSPREALPYIHQICAGLGAAHDCNILHRDLKPSNVYVLEGETLRLKILDFGLAKRVASRQKITVGGMGSPLYAAPEIVSGCQEQIGPQSDLFSLGVMIYEMLTGQMPYDFSENIEPHELIRLPLTHNFIPLYFRNPDIPTAVASQVEKCLAKKAAQRPPSAPSFFKDFEKAVLGALELGGPLKVRTQNAALRIHQPLNIKRNQRRRPLTIVSLALFFLVGMIGIGSYYRSFPSEKDAAKLESEVLRSPPAEAHPSLAEYGTKKRADSEVASNIISGSNTIPRAPNIFFQEKKPHKTIAKHHDQNVQIVITAKKINATCEIKLESGVRAKPLAPCRFLVPRGSLVRLKVTSKGYHSFYREWRAMHSRNTYIGVNKMTRRIEPHIALAIPKMHAEPALKPHAEPARKKNLRAKKLLNPGSDVSLPEKKTSKRIGVGIMEY